MVNQINNLNTKQRRIIRVKKILLLRANKENILSRSTFSPFNSYSSCSRTSTKIFSSKNLDNYINLQDFLNKIHQTNLEFNENNENNENIEIKLTRQERNRLSAKANRDKKNNDLECLTGKVQQLQNQNEFLQTLLSKYPPHLVAQVESRLRAKHELEIRDNSLQQQSFFPDHE